MLHAQDPEGDGHVRVAHRDNEQHRNSSIIPVERVLCAVPESVSARSALDDVTLGGHTTHLSAIVRLAWTIRPLAG